MRIAALLALGFGAVLVAALLVLALDAGMPWVVWFALTGMVASALVLCFGGVLEATRSDRKK